MKKEELTKVFAYAKLLWNNFVVPNDDENKLLQIQIWYDFLKEYDFETIFASMRELCKVSDFCNIGKIAKGCQTICNLSQNRDLEEEQILKEINKAITACGSPKEKFEKLSPIAKKVVGDSSNLYKYGLVDMNDYDTFVVSNLKKSIKANLERQEKIQSIGENVLEQIALKESQNRIMIENSENKNKFIENS